MKNPYPKETKSFIEGLNADQKKLHAELLKHIRTFIRTTMPDFCAIQAMRLYDNLEKSILRQSQLLYAKRSVNIMNLACGYSFSLAAIDFICKKHDIKYTHTGVDSDAESIKDAKIMYADLPATFVCGNAVVEGKIGVHKMGWDIIILANPHIGSANNPLLREPFEHMVEKMVSHLSTPMGDFITSAPTKEEYAEIIGCCTWASLDDMKSNPFPSLYGIEKQGGALLEASNYSSAEVNVARAHADPVLLPLLPIQSIQIHTDDRGVLQAGHSTPSCFQKLLPVLGRASTAKEKGVIPFVLFKKAASNAVKQHYYADAACYFQRMIEINDGNEKESVLYYNLGRMLMKLELYDVAEKALKTAKSKDKKSLYEASHLECLGHVEFSNGKYPAALDQFKDAQAALSVGKTERHEQLHESVKACYSGISVSTGGSALFDASQSAVQADGMNVHLNSNSP